MDVMLRLTAVKQDKHAVIRSLTLSWISSLMVGFLLVERGTLSQFTRGLMVRP